jgi:hypothetical protein
MAETEYLSTRELIRLVRELADRCEALLEWREEVGVEPCDDCTRCDPCGPPAWESFMPAAPDVRWETPQNPGPWCYGYGSDCKAAECWTGAECFDPRPAPTDGGGEGADA